MSEHPLAECLAQSKVLNKCELLPVCIIMCLHSGKQKPQRTLVFLSIILKREVGLLLPAKTELEI